MTPPTAAQAADDRHRVLKRLKAAIDRRLDALLPPAMGGDQLGLALRESALSPGKRVRPLLALLTAEGLGCTSPAVLEAGCALEMVHTASLLLDDLPCMDDATLRRGRPAIHIRFGEDVAVLAAIALLSRGFGLLANAPGVAPATAARLVATLAEAVGTEGLVGGQYADLRQAAEPRGIADIAATNDRKTGALFVAAVQMASLIAGADEATAGSLRRFGVELGQAFQLLDDLLDRAPSAEALGKDVGQDAGKSTMLETLGHEAAQARLRQHLGEALGCLSVLREGSLLPGFVAALFSEAADGLSLR